MLLRLHIRNVALIDEIEIEFGSGLNILTGETGAGKSIIIDSVNMLLGERVSRDLIRTGQEKASLEALFHLPDGDYEKTLAGYGIEGQSDGSLIISREYALNGRSVCRINGTLCTVSVLKEIGALLLDIHGQHDHQSLLKNENHLKMLDEFGKEGLYRLSQEYSGLFSRQREISGRLKELTGDEIKRQRLTDLLKYQIDEIHKAGLKKDEDTVLSEQRKYLSSSEKIKSILEQIYDDCFATGSGKALPVSDTVFDAASKLGEIEQFKDDFVKVRTRLESVGYELDDIREEIRSLKDEIDYDPRLLEKIDVRLDSIFNLKKKYGKTIDEVLVFYHNAKDELETLENSEELVKKLNGELAGINGRMGILAGDISRIRKNTAQKLQTQIVNQLKDLEMKNTDFKVKFEDTESFTATGTDKVEFLISTNEGEPLKPLSKIASGGEMARIMLAIKTILADTDKIPSLIFDEIDIGISGRASRKVGEKLLGLTSSHQVICVTHQAQIAVMADNHFLIEKVTGDGKTLTKVYDIKDDLRINEISRLLDGGAVTDKTRDLASYMIEEAGKIRTARRMT